MNSKGFIVALLGMIVQYYDHYLFGLSAAIISKHFIMASDQTMKLFYTYFIMFLAVTAKPVGSIVLGRIGDLYGRSTTFTLSLIGTSFGSLIISIIPGYEHIGMTAALVLLIARMCIMSCIAPGTDGVRIFIYEQIGNNNKSLGNGLATAASCIGIFIASCSAWFFTLETMPEYAWRFSFLLGSLMGMIVIIIRKYAKVDDSNFTKSEIAYEDFKNLPILTIIRQNLKLFLTILLVAGSIGSTNQFYIVFFGNYNLSVLEIVDQSSMKFYTSVAIAIYMFFAIIGGLVADYFGLIKVAIIAFVILLIITIMMMLDIANMEPSIGLFFATMACLPFLTMPTLSFLKQSIPVVIRYRLFSLAHSIGSLCISTPTAGFATFLYHETKNSWLPFCCFLFAITMIAFGVIVLSREYSETKEQN